METEWLIAGTMKAEMYIVLTLAVLIYTCLWPCTAEADYVFMRCASKIRCGCCGGEDTQPTSTNSQNPVSAKEYFSISLMFLSVFAVVVAQSLYIQFSADHRFAVLVILLLLVGGIVAVAVSFAVRCAVGLVVLVSGLAVLYIVSIYTDGGASTTNYVMLGLILAAICIVVIARNFLTTLVGTIVLALLCSISIVYCILYIRQTQFTTIEDATDDVLRADVCFASINKCAIHWAIIGSLFVFKMLVLTIYTFFIATRPCWRRVAESSNGWITPPPTVNVQGNSSSTALTGTPQGPVNGDTDITIIDMGNNQKRLKSPSRPPPKTKKKRDPTSSSERKKLIKTVAARPGPISARPGPIQTSRTESDSDDSYDSPVSAV